MDNPVLVFVRVKPNTHCMGVLTKLKRHEVLWVDGNNAIIKMPKMFFDCDKNWLLRYPILSCFTEVQLINPRSEQDIKLRELKKKLRRAMDISNNAIRYAHQEWIKRCEPPFEVAY